MAAGLGGAATNLLAVFQNAARPESLADVDRWRFILSQGPLEAIGPLPLSLMFATIQLVAWALVERSLELRAPKLAGTSK